MSVLQLEFFPRTEFRSLFDFQRLECNNLSLEDKKKLISYSDFFESPKENDVISIQHSCILDRILDFRTKYTEEMLVAEAKEFDPDGSYDSWGPALHYGVQTWVGLDLETLQTPYSECLQILQLLKIKPYQHIVDLGAAYGRLGIVLGGLFIKNSFTGYEYVKARVDEGNRIYKNFGLSKCHLVQRDLFDPEFELPHADVFFIYDFGQVNHIDHVLNQIKEVACKRPVKVVARGKYSKQIIKENHQWLALRYEGRPSRNLSIYTAYIS